MATLLTANFALEEFERASHRALTPAEKEAARWWAVEVLQPARRVVGPIRITSFVRTGAAIGGGCHADGSAVDVIALERPQRELWEWLATYKIGVLGELELDPTPGNEHVHLTRRPCGGVGEVLVKREDGSFELGQVSPEWMPRLLLLAIGAAVLLAFLLRWLGK